MSESVLKPAQVGCTALDLWGARCGVVHTYSPRSRRENGGAKPVIYKWAGGPSPHGDVQLPSGYVVVVIEALHQSFLNAVGEFLKDTNADPALRLRVEQRLQHVFCYRPWPAIASGVA